MSKISIKIVEVDQSTRSIVLKFATEHSAKPLDEYDGLAFTVANFGSLTPEEFIEKIRPQISEMVLARDAAEQLVDTLDVTEWAGYTTTIDAIEVPQIDIALVAHLIPGLTNPEVIL
jgi:hypothetical protein